MNQTLHSFVEQCKKSNDQLSLQQLIRYAIEHYQLQSREEASDVQTIVVASMAEENLLSRIVKIASGDEEIDIEALYEGAIVRDY